MIYGVISITPKHYNGKIVPKKLPKGKKQAVNVTFRIDPDHLAYLKIKCIEMSYRDKNMYTVGMLIRETLLQAYPLPKSSQLDMFS